MHANQLTVDAATVRSLVDQQFPRWRGLQITPVDAAGTVNRIFRIGDGLSARFPLVVDDVAAVRSQLEAEAEAGRELLGRTRVATPEPVALGNPGAGWPGPWSVQTWLAGTVATEQDPSGSVAFAHDLAEFVRDVRALPSCGRSFNGTGRGGDLGAHETWVQTCFARSTGLLDVARLRALWHDFRELPRVDDDVMTHGDLIPGNLLVTDGRLTGVLDVGGLGAADPALDLVGAWHVLEDGPRRTFRDDLACGDLEWERGKAWAFVQAMGVVWYYVESNPTMSQMGRRTLSRLLGGQ
jgi:aminoglycoside phosphotransferase (APT) family kinase protein